MISPTGEQSLLAHKDSVRRLALASDAGVCIQNPDLLIQNPERHGGVVKGQNNRTQPHDTG